MASTSTIKYTSLLIAKAQGLKLKEMLCATCEKTSGLGIYEGITLTLVCAWCASSSTWDDGKSLVCLSKAKELFPLITPKRLKTLGSTARRNPCYKNATPMHMYSLAELIVLGRRVEHGLRLSTALLKKKRQERLERMVRLHGVTPASAQMHQSLFGHIFGDYIWADRPTKKLHELKYRFSAQQVSVQMCPADPVCAMNHIENRQITRPQWERDFDQTVADFERSLFLTARVFRLEGLSIARYICPAQLSQLKNGSLNSISASVERLKKNAPRMLRMALRSLKFDKCEVERMMSCPAMKTRIRRCMEYAHDPETVSRKMAAFWLTRTDRKHRRQILQSAMGKKGLQIRADSVYCHDFVYGGIDVDLDEIVGIQYITRELFDLGGPRFWSANHDTCESAFRQALLENGNDIDNSINIGLGKCTRRRRW